MGWPSANVLESGRRPARALLFFGRPKKRRQKKSAPTTCPPLRCGFPALLGQNRRSGTRGFAPQTPLASPGFLLRCSAASKGTGYSVGCFAWLFAWGQINAPLATAGCRATQKPADRSEGCLSDRQGASSRARRDSSSAGKSRQRRGQPAGASAFGYFWHKQLAAQNSRRLARRVSVSESNKSNKEFCFESRTGSQKIKGIPCTQRTVGWARGTPRF